MKKVLKSLALIAAAAMTLASCQNELQPNQPEVTVTKGKVHVEFGATSDEPQTKVTLGTNDDIKFEADWITDADKLSIEYIWLKDEDLDEGTVLSAPWNGTKFAATMSAPMEGDVEVAADEWGYTCYYPEPTRSSGELRYFAFGASREQQGSVYNGAYDLMKGGKTTYNSKAGKDGENDIVFNMDRLTSIAYFHITTSGFDASEKLATAILEITEADNTIIASDEVYCASGEIYADGANQSSSITLNTTQAMDDIKLWYNVIPLTFKKATLTLTTDKGKYIVLKMGDGSTEFSYKPGELQKAKIGPIPASVFIDPTPTPAEAFYTLTFARNNNASNYAASYSVTSNDATWTVYGNLSMGDELRVGGGKSSPLNNVDRTITSNRSFSESVNKIVVNHSGTSAKSGSSITINSVSAILATSSDFASISIVEQKTISSPSVSSEGAIEIELDDAHENCYVRVAVNVTTTGSDNSYLTINSVELFEGNAKEKFNINVQDVTGGTITASKTQASEGTEITLLATPASSRYEFSSWNVTNASTSEAITVTENKFTMPAAAVNVSATFNKLPYKVTYNKNTDDTSFAGTVPTDAKNYTDADNEVTVADGSGLTRDDYTFASWNTKANGEGTSYESGDKFSISDDVTLYAQWTRNTYEVTIETPVNGTLVIKNGETVVNSGDKLQSGVTLTVVPTPATGYRFDKWGYKDGDKTWVNNMTSTFTHVMPMAPVQFKVTFEEIPTHVVKFSVNGTIVNGGGEGETLGEGAAITFPADPVAIGDMKFQGWVTSSIDEPTDTKPSFVSKAGQTVGTEDVTYYAVFANVVEGTTSYKLVSSLTNGKNYIFVTRNTAGSGYALSSNVTTGTPVTIAESGADKVVSGTPAKTIIWTAATGWSLTNTGVDSNNKLLINGTSFTMNNTGSSNLSWTTNYGLNGRSSGTTKYYVQCNSTGTFSKSSTSGSTTNRVYAYEEDSTGGTSGYCTTVELPKVLQSIYFADGCDVENKDYSAGQALNPTGLIVMGHYDKGEDEDITSLVSWTFDPETLSAGTTSCRVFASYGGEDASITVSGLTVTEPVTLSSIEVSGTPKKITYNAGDALDTEGLVVTGTYSDRHTAPITEGITWTLTPETLSAGTESCKVVAHVGKLDSPEYEVKGLTVNGSVSHDYKLVEASLSDWRGDYLIAYSDNVFMDGSLNGGTGGVGKAQTHVAPGTSLSSDKKTVAQAWGDQHYVTIEAINDSDLSKGYVIKSHYAGTSATPYFYQTSNANGMACTATKTTAANYPITVDFVSSSDIQLKLGGSAAGAILHYNANSGSSGEMFRYYKNGSQSKVYLYKKQ